VDQEDHADHDPAWWTRSVQDHLGPRSDIILMGIGRWRLEDFGMGFSFSRLWHIYFGNY